jgi:8-oxo-dGTP pyrophosphatase MutT (NUDIX family)
MPQSKTGVAFLLPAYYIHDSKVADHLFLAISRRNDPELFGIPGGKVDPGESELEAVQRETDEEVALLGSSDQFQTIYSGLCVDYWVTGYLWVGTKINLNHLAAEPGLELKWLSREELCDPLISPFSEYNKKIFKAYDDWLKHNATLH